MNWIKNCSITLFTFLCSQLHIIKDWMIVLIVIMALDYITGMMASAMKKEISSKKGLLGILKKTSYLLVVCVATAVDWIFIHTGGIFEIELPQKMTVTIIICIWLIINELISILENLDKMSVPLPRFLKKLLLSMKDRTDDKLL